MPRTLGHVFSSTAAGLVAFALLLGCGATTPAGAPVGDQATQTTGGPTAGPVDFTLVRLLSRTAAGGEVDEVAVPLPDRAAVAEFSSQLRSAALGKQLAAAVTDAELAGDQALVGAVIAIGCDVPPGVRVSHDGEQLRIVPLEVVSPHVECFAPVTSVALVAVDADLL